MHMAVFVSTPRDPLPCGCSLKETKACFKRRAAAVPNSIDRIKFDFCTAVARSLKPSRATAL